MFVKQPMRRNAMPERADQASARRAATKGIGVGFGIVTAALFFGFSVLAGYSTGRMLGEGDTAGSGLVSTR